MNDDIKLFKNEGDVVALPSQDLKVDETLMKDDLDNKIMGQVVKVLDIPEDTEIEDENYIFDFGEVGIINVMQKKALTALISKDGDIRLYLYNKKNGLFAFGYGEKYKLEKIIPILRRNVLDDEVKVYKNYKIGERPVEVKDRDITKMRLNL